METQVKQNNTTLTKTMSLLNSAPVLLLLGVLLNSFNQMRWNIPLLAWISFIPFLRYTRLEYNKTVLALALFATFTLSTARIISEPMHIILAVVSGLQMMLGYLIVLTLTNKIRKGSKSKTVSIFAFATFIVTYEWMGALFSPLGTWGMLANSQVENLVLLQLASVTGAFGISFLIALSNSVLESSLNEIMNKTGFGSFKPAFVLVLGLIIAYTFGGVRLFTTLEGPGIRVASISTKYEIAELLQSEKLLGENDKALFQMTKEAAEAKAQVVVWNEGATMVKPEKEGDLLQDLQKTAKQNSIDIVAGYVTLLDPTDFKFENKALYVKSNGDIAFTYYKQFIPPGEPAVYIPSEHQITQTGGANIGVAICYDFDSLALTKNLAKTGADIIAIVASDWKGIDPFHNQMAAMRGIEQGYSIVRSTRGAASIAFDPYGRVRAWNGYYEKNDGIMYATVPGKKVNTVYATISDTFAALCATISIYIIFIRWFLRKK